MGLPYSKLPILFPYSLGILMGIVWAPQRVAVFGHSRFGESPRKPMSGNLHNPRVATGKLVALGNQKRWVEAIQLLGVHWKKQLELEDEYGR